MRVTYNGINLSVVRPVQMERQVVYDPTGKDYLGTKWTIGVVAIYTPDVASSATGPGKMVHVTGGSSINRVRGTLPPDRQPDPLTPSQGVIDPNNINHTPVFNSPVWTDAALRHRLMQPRGKLRVTFGSSLDPNRFPGTDQEVHQLWLESPGRLPGQQQEAFCDLDNGPKPTVHSVRDVYGDGRLFLVVFGVETTVNDCTTGTASDGANPPGGPNPLPNTPGSPLLSNQWTGTLSYDEQYLATRTVQGMAIFRADVVNRFIRDPDQYRLDILPPIPGNCKRFIDELTQMPDGYTYTYTVRDVEQAITYQDRPKDLQGVPIPGRNPRNVTVFDVEVNRRYEQIGAKAGFQGLLSQMANLNFAGIGEGGSISQVGKDLGSLGDLLGPLKALMAPVQIGLDKLQRQVNAINKVAMTTTVLANEFLPTFVETITVTVAGNRFAKMGELQYLAFAAAFGQATSPVGLRNSAFANFLGTQAGIAIGSVIGEIMGSLLMIPGGELLGGVAGAGITGIIQRAFPNDYLAFLATANVWDITYSPTRKQLQFTLTTEYSGLVDWMVGGTAGGFRAMTTPIPDEVVGGDWPQSAKNNQFLSGSTAQPEATNHLYPMRDAGLLLATPMNTEGIGPPVFSQNGSTTDPTKRKMGSNMAAIIAQKLMEECERPGKMAGDAQLAADPEAEVGFAILRSSGKQLIP